MSERIEWTPKLLATPCRLYLETMTRAQLPYVHIKQSFRDKRALQAACVTHIQILEHEARAK